MSYRIDVLAPDKILVSLISTETPTPAEQMHLNRAAYQVLSQTITDNDTALGLVLERLTPDIRKRYGTTLRIVSQDK